MLKIITLGLTILCSPVHALTKTEAQQCANVLLDAYQLKKYPKTDLNVQYIIASAVGPIFRRKLDREQQTLMQIGEQVLRESFEKPTGRYQFQSIEVHRVINGTKAVGHVALRSPQGTSEYYFEAISARDRCYIKAVTVGNWFSLRTFVNNELNVNSQTARLLQDNKK